MVSGISVSANSATNLRVVGLASLSDYLSCSGGLYDNGLDGKQCVDVLSEDANDWVRIQALGSRNTDNGELRLVHA